MAGEDDKITPLKPEEKADLQRIFDATNKASPETAKYMVERINYHRENWEVEQFWPEGYEKSPEQEFGDDYGQNVNDMDVEQEKDEPEQEL